MFEEQDKKTAQEWEPTAERADAIQYILAVTNCPEQVRSLITILLGISKGYPEFDTTQSHIASRITGENVQAVDENKKQWVKRAHQKMKKWQTDNELNLIEYEPGSRKSDGTYIQSRYRLQILHFADKVIDLAKQNPEWDKNKTQAIKDAAEQLKEEYCPINVMYHRHWKEQSPSSIFRRYISSSVKYMKKALAMIDQKNDIILIDDEIIEEFEKVLKELKSSRLSEDFFLKADKKKSSKKGNNPPSSGGSNMTS